MRYFIFVLFLTGCGSFEQAVSQAESTGTGTGTGTDVAAEPASAPAVTAGAPTVVVNTTVNVGSTFRDANPESPDLGPAPNDAILVQNRRDLPSCIQDAGRLYYIMADDEFAACEDGEWTPVPLTNAQYEGGR